MNEARNSAPRFVYSSESKNLCHTALQRKPRNAQRQEGKHRRLWNRDLRPCQRSVRVEIKFANVFRRARKCTTVKKFLGVTNCIVPTGDLRQIGYIRSSINNHVIIPRSFSLKLRVLVYGRGYINSSHLNTSRRNKRRSCCIPSRSRRPRWNTPCATFDHIQERRSRPIGGSGRPIHRRIRSPRNRGGIRKRTNKCKTCQNKRLHG